MNLGENIYRLRTERNMSQGDLADALDVSRQSVSKWENSNAVPELEKLLKMSDLFGITLDELVGSPTVPEPASDASHSIQKHTLIGIALLCCSILSTAAFLIFGQLLWALLISLPLGIGSIYCLVSSRRIRRNLTIAILAAVLIIVLCALGVLIINLADFAINSTGVTSTVTQETALLN